MWTTLALGIEAMKIGLLALLNPTIVGLTLYAAIAWLAARMIRPAPEPGRQSRPIRNDP